MHSTTTPNGTSPPLRLAAPPAASEGIAPPPPLGQVEQALAAAIRQAVADALAAADTRQAELQEQLAATGAQLAALVEQLRSAAQSTSPAPTETPTARHWSRQQFAEELGICVSSFDRGVRAGRIGPRPIRVGGRVVFDASEAERWLAARKPDGRLADSREWEAIQAVKRSGKR